MKLINPSPPTAECPPSGWNTPRPETLPLPTWWPAATALGTTLAAWGLISSVLVLGIGMLVFLVALAGWIGDIRHERRQP
jgi:hypothetical protein